MRLKILFSMTLKTHINVEDNTILSVKYRFIFFRVCKVQIYCSQVTLYLHFVFPCQKLCMQNIIDCFLFLLNCTTQCPILKVRIVFILHLQHETHANCRNMFFTTFRFFKKKQKFYNF